MIAIAAVDENFGIGYKGDLLVRIPEDMKRFRKLTTGNVVVYGRNTLAGFPNGKPLKDRVNIILSGDPNFHTEDVIVVRTKDALLKEIEKYDKDSVFLIGGGNLYRQLINNCDKIFLTKISGTYDADTYFPNIDNMDNWKITREEKTATFGKIDYQFVEYSWFESWKERRYGRRTNLVGK